jgi:ribonuclease-3
MFIGAWVIQLRNLIPLMGGKATGPIKESDGPISQYFPLETIPQLENDLGIRFENHSLLVNALTHSSYASENKDIVDNERLEFLGDAILGAAISCLIFDKCFNMDEGELTVLKSKIVNGNSLYASAKRFGLGNYLLLGKGENKNGGRSKVSILSSALEAVFGAVFIDKGFDTTCTLIDKLLSYELNKAIGDKRKDAKTQLQEIVQAKVGGLPKYHIVSQTGEGDSSFFVSEVFITGKVYAVGEGSSKLISEMKAAEKALGHINNGEL